jgi:tetratricopeptide (TPR) repeat protein
VAESGSDTVDPALADAIAEVEKTPDDGEAWDALEQLADDLQQPDPVMTAYRQVLDGGLSRKVAPQVADRAVKFCQAWYIDTPEAMPELLGAIVEKYPAIGWAFERLVVHYTSAAKWEELLALYDRALSATRSEKKRTKLLHEASDLAKDFADQPDRAADYLQQLLRLEPDNDKHASSLERLLERRERWDELLALWADQIPKLSTENARATRARIAKICLEKLDAPDRAVAELRELVEENPGHAEACEQLERILSLDTAGVDTRREALSLLRKTYEIVERPDDVVRVLESALGFVTGDDARSLHREAGNRLSILGRDSDAMRHFAAVLQDSPGDADAKKQLRNLAKRSERPDLHVEALLAAAEAAAEPAQRVSLWLEAATIRHRALEDVDGAIELYQRALDTTEENRQEGAGTSEALRAAQRLDQLLAEAGRDADRLAVLERLSVLEQSPSFRRQVLGEAARLAQRLEQYDRALACWQQILQARPEDLEALDASIELLEASERWAELVESVRRRAEAAVSTHQKRADLVRVAQVQATQLEDPEAAIATWLEIRENIGEDAEVVGALDRLLTDSEKWSQLAEILGGAVGRELGETATRLVRLADVSREQLDDAAQAAELYRRALVLDPSDADARAGMSKLLEGSQAATAAEALWRAYETNGEWEQMLELVPARSAAELDSAKRAQIFADAARLHEERGEDATAACAAMGRAVPLAPSRLDLRSALVRLAAASDSWDVALEALAGAAAGLAGEPEAAAELRRQQAAIAEEHLADWEKAFDAHLAASELVPDDIVELANVVRSAARAGRWDAAGKAVVSHARLIGRSDKRLLTEIEDAAKGADAWGDAAAGVVAALDAGKSGLAPAVASSLYGRAAEWYRDQTDDRAAATAAAQAAVDLTPDDAAALHRLVTLQRDEAGPELADTLLLIDRVGDENSLDALREAADVAADDDERAIRVLERLYRKAATMWQAGIEHTGSYPADHTAQWAIEQLTERLVGAGERERAAQLLLAAGELPMTPQRRAELNRRAAELLVEINKPLPAIEAYRRVLADQRDDIDTIQKLATLCEKEEAKTGSVALRERELELTEDLDERLKLRLAMSRRAAELENRSGRVQSLLDNLADQPGHAASIDALTSILDERGHYDKLAGVLEDQAAKLNEIDPDTSANLWTRAADVAERKLRDAGRAMAAHRQVVSLTAAPRSLDALARLHVDKGEPGEAAKWLTKRLEAAAAAERVPVLLKLARTHQQAGREGEAIATLQTAFSEAPQSAEVRKQLLPLLRQREDWKALASTLATSVEHAGDDATVLAYAREAADIYYNRLDEPGKAVPVLRRAVELAPDDRLLKRMLGDGLRDEGELEEAKELLTTLVEAFGRRGSSERAEAHLSLAKVLHELGEHEDALGQLDIASKMDSDNVAILRTLAAQAREIGQLQRAEAALRTLLLTARRLQSDGTSEVPIGTSEVLFELSSIARARGQNDQAEELAESAIEALADNDARAPQLQKKLAEQGEHELLIRLLDARLEYVQSPYRRGAILGQKAKMLDAIDRAEEAFDTRLAAIDADPGSPLLHEGTRELAVELDHLDRYTAHLDKILERSRRDTDAMIRCEVLLRLGEINEQEHEDFEAASKMYDEAEATGVREVDVLRARARVAGARGDEEEQMRILEELANLGEDQVETRADAMYRIAEVQLSADETLEQGLETLRKAIDDHRRPARACKVLMRATELHPDHEGLLDAYELVARDSGDDQMLLHYLERRAGHQNATTDHVREAVNKAREVGEVGRAEKLMERAVEIGRESGEGLYALDWALLGLADMAKERGDVEAAVRWLEQAADVAEAEPLFALCREVAAMSGEGEQPDRTVAAKLYEKLRERDPTAREAWEPLVEIYADLGDIDALERVVRETLDGLQEVTDRNALRLGLARALLTDEGRIEDAIGVLRDALFDEPGHTDALGLLTESLERAGKQDELVDLLRDQLIGAQDRGDGAAAKATALRLGPMLDREDAVGVYRDALALEDDAELLQAMLDVLGEDHDPVERASLGERLLKLREGDEAAALTRELADAYQALDDTDGQVRVLEAGLERAPGDAAIRERLEQHYRETGDSGGLARILEATAETATDPAKKVELLRNAADVQARELGDATRAVELLTQAREIAPDDPRIAVTMASCMTMSGDAAGAIAMLTETLEGAADEHHLELLRARAQARRATDDDAGAIADLETAYEQAPKEVANELVDALEDRRMRASMNNETDAEREATMRMVAVLLDTEDRERALGMLTDWTGRTTDDLDALRRLRDLQSEDGRWEDLARTCIQLLDVETGDDQANSASMLLEAYVQVGAPEHARETLEQVWAAQPDNPVIRGAVRRLYELIGANQELAKLLIEEAATLEDAEEKVAHLRWAGEALLSVGDIQSAIPALTQVLELKEDDAQARCLLADANVMMGRFPEAHALLDEAISQSRRSSPDLYMFHHRKAYVYHAAGDHEGQLDSLKKAHQHARKNGQIAAELADLAEALEQWDLAVSTLRTITTIDDGCPIAPADALVRQGRIAHRLGDDKRARLCARRAAMTDADAESVKAFLAELGE